MNDDSQSAAGTPAAAGAPAPVPVADRWDAGDLGCGELVVELRARLMALAGGSGFELIAHDPGVREDLPAWCRLTGHLLAHAEPPRYLIIRREDS